MMMNISRDNLSIWILILCFLNQLMILIGKYTVNSHFFRVSFIFAKLEVSWK